MIFYEVTAVPEPDVREAYEHYMRSKHVSDVLASGCFVAARIAVTAEGLYRTTYVAATRDVLDRYLAEHAPRLRADFAEHIPAGVKLSREILDVVQEWP
jgi:hypothetical protein